MPSRLGLLVISAIFFGIAIANVITKPLTESLGINFFDTTIPGVSPELAALKEYDLINYFLVILASLFLLIIYFYKDKPRFDGVSLETLLLGVSITMSIYTYFVTYSKRLALFIIIFSNILYLYYRTRNLTYLNIQQFLRSENIFSGIFTGVYLVLITNHFFNISVLVFGVFLLTIIGFLLTERTFKYYPAGLLVLSVFLASKLTLLFLLGVSVLSIWWGLYFFKLERVLKKIRRLYPLLIIFLVVFNPTFYIGDLDIVEEGFLLGWVHHLNEGRVLYKDITAYHPPLIPFGMYLFMKISGFNIFNERLFLHLLQILGITIFFVFLKKIIQNNWVSIFIITLFLSIGSISVKNNFEIRIAMGLLSLFFLFRYIESFKKELLIVTGLCTSLSLLTSIEVGLVTFLLIYVSLNLFTYKEKIEDLKITNLWYLGGISLGLIPFLVFFVITNSLTPALEQIGFYIKAFSTGYFNLTIERPISLSYFHWHIFYQYLHSNAFYWELTRVLLIFGAGFFTVKRYAEKKLELREVFILIISFYGLLLFRSALGRSDIYHLVMVMPLALVILGYFLEKIGKKSLILLTIWVLLFFNVFYKSQFNSVFLEDQLFKWQTYGRIYERYWNLNFERGQGVLFKDMEKAESINKLAALVDKKTDPLDSIFTFPWSPQLYFLFSRNNPTKVDIPLSFFSDKYQNEMIEDLKKTTPKMVIIDNDARFGDLKADSLTTIYNYIQRNYHETDRLGSFTVLAPN